VNEKLPGILAQKFPTHQGTFLVKFFRIERRTKHAIAQDFQREFPVVLHGMRFHPERVGRANASMEPPMDSSASAI